MNVRKDLEEIAAGVDDEETKHLQMVCSLVSQVSNNVHETVQNIETTELNLEEILVVSEEISEKFDSLIPLMIASKNEENESTVNELYAKWRDARIQHERDQDEIKHLKSQILIHSGYCSNVGAVLGNFVWRASGKSEMVNMWLSERRCLKKLGEMLTITDRVIESFFKTYDDVLPPTNTDEYEFPMGLLGTVSNISASAEGRQFLIENAEGKNLVKNLVKYFPLIPTDSGGALKELIMVILWNTSVNEDGLEYLFEVQVGQVVLHCLDEKNTEKLKTLGLTLLQSITHNLVEPRLFDDLLKCVPIGTIRRLADDERNEKVTRLAREVLDYLTNREKSILRLKNDR